MIKVIADFMAREGIINLASGHIVCPVCKGAWDGEFCYACGAVRSAWDEPFFSWAPCDCCGTTLGGDREYATAYNPTTGKIQEYTVCSDCIYYAEYGD